MAQMIPFIHQASPVHSMVKPQAWERPDRVGPNARARLAVEAATPLIVPKTSEDGAALVKRIALDGKAVTWKVILHSRHA